jgi:hypothetical protein
VIAEVAPPDQTVDEIQNADRRRIAGRQRLKIDASRSPAHLLPKERFAPCVKSLSMLSGAPLPAKPGRLLIVVYDACQSRYEICIPGAAAPRGAFRRTDLLHRACWLTNSMLMTIIVDIIPD